MGNSGILNIRKEFTGHYWALFSYTMWGVFPLYWKALAEFSSLEILSHRIFWSFWFYVIILLILKKSINWQIPKELYLAAALISANWLMYIYAVNSGHVLQGSLAYFLTPFLNILFGWSIFSEKFTLQHKISMALAFLGVLLQFENLKQFPWLSIGMGLTFSLYGVIKKRIPSSPLNSGLLETMALLPISFLIIIYFRFYQTSGSPAATSTDWALFVLAGAVTGLPLLGFTIAAQNIKYSTIGMYQFISPTIQFLLAVFLYKEDLSLARLIGFIFIWLGLLIYILPIQPIKKS